MNHNYFLRRVSGVFAAVVLTLAASPIRATTPVTVPLYDASGGSLPNITNGWFYGESPTGAGVQTLTGGAANLNTTGAMSGKAGWGTALSAGTMDPTAGYTLDFTTKVESQTNSSNDRSGFDVLMISTDIHKALELAFWTNQVFALEGDSPTPAFTHAEGTTGPFDATVYHNYQLSVLGSNYTLYDGTTPLFSGALRDYSGSTATFGPLLIYQTPRALFFGDDTTSAQAIADVQKVSLVTAALPEVGSLALIAVGCLAFVRRRR